MGAILSCEVDSENDGKTVERILKKVFGISSTLLVYLKNNSRLRLNGNVCRSVDVCSTGDILTVDVSENLECCPENIAPYDAAIDVLYEDDFLLVVNKPSGMASHPCPGNYENSLANTVMHYWSCSREYHNYHIVNRLDKDTTGICLIAKNRFAHSVLSAQMKNMAFERGYTAIVHGVICPKNGVIEAAIGRCKDSIIKRMVAPDGKYAKTLYKTINSNDKRLSLIDIQLETGRTHQIRVHFSYIGHPLVGDWLYGMGDDEKNLISRHALHAGYIKFFHPSNKKEMVFRSELPKDMKKLYYDL